MSEPTYTINITSIKTKDVEGLGTILKQVNYDFTAEMGGHTVGESRVFEFLEGPEAAVLMQGLTRAGIIEALEQKDPTLPGIRSYNKFLLEKIIAEEALQEAPIPD